MVLTSSFGESMEDQIFQHCEIVLNINDRAFTHTHTHTHIYIYVCMYVYCHPQTECLVISQPFSVARHVEHLKLGSKPAQIYVRLSILPLSPQVTYVISGIIRHYVVAFVCLHFTLLSYIPCTIYHMVQSVTLDFMQSAIIGRCIYI